MKKDIPHHEHIQLSPSWPPYLGRHWKPFPALSTGNSTFITSQAIGPEARKIRIHDQRWKPPHWSLSPFNTESFPSITYVSFNLMRIQFLFKGKSCFTTSWSYPAIATPSNCLFHVRKNIPLENILHHLLQKLESDFFDGDWKGFYSFANDE